MDEIEPGSVGRASWRVGALTALFGAEILAIAALSAPLEWFPRFAFADSGADLVIRDLIARGFRPTIDFGYIYGLLPLLINRVWYTLASPTPAAFRAGVLACNLVMAWGMARFAVAQRAGAAGVALILAAMPYVLHISVLALVQALEPAVLVHALAEQARGRRRRALALATVALFIKPSMAYIYGALLLILIGLAARGRGASWWLRELAPAAATGAALALLLGAIYGARPLLNTLMPGAGAEVYRQGGYGFFHGRGLNFWYKPQAYYRDYFLDPAGGWLVGSVLLIRGALGWLRRGPGWPEFNGEVVATCAALHVAFVTLFFGNRLSWVYYYAILLLGLAAIAPRGRIHSGFIAAVAVLAIVADRPKLDEIRRRWQIDAPAPATLGLWATREERLGWERVLELTRGRRPALVSIVEGAAVLYPGFAPPTGSYFVPGHPRPAEIRRKAEQVASSSTVILGLLGPGSYSEWPELAAAFDGLQMVWGNGHYRVYERIRPPRRPGARAAASAR